MGTFLFYFILIVGLIPVFLFIWLVIWHYQEFGYSTTKFSLSSSFLFLVILSFFYFSLYISLLLATTLI